MYGRDILKALRELVKFPCDALNPVQERRLDLLQSLLFLKSITDVAFVVTIRFAVARCHGLRLAQEHLVHKILPALARGRRRCGGGGELHPANPRPRLSTHAPILFKTPARQFLLYDTRRNRTRLLRASWLPAC